MSYTCYNWNWDEVGYLSKRGNGSSDVSYIAIGIAIGIALGVALDNIAIGIALGVAVGAGLDGMKKKK